MGKRDPRGLTGRVKTLRLAVVLGSFVALTCALACGDAADEETELAVRGSGGRAGQASQGGNDLPGGSGGKVATGSAGGGGSTSGGAAGAGDDEDEDDGGAGGASGGAASTGGTSGASSGGASGMASGGSAGNEGTAGTSGAAAVGGASGAGGTAPAHPVPECAYATVNTPGKTLNVRPDPSTNGAVIAVLQDNTPVEVLAKVDGQAVDGTTLWYKIKGAGAEGFVYSPFIACSATKPPDPPPLDGFYLPLACGMKVACTQGNNGSVSHTGNIKYAFDFSLGANTPLRAAAPGTVVAIYNSTGPGHSCYNGGGPSCSPYSNYVLIRHADNTQTIYKHLNKVDVAVGQVVARGQHIGLSGKTGYATGNHLHIMRQNAGPFNAASIPMTFSDAGVPTTGQTVTSGNCP